MIEKRTRRGLEFGALRGAIEACDPDALLGFLGFREPYFPALSAPDGDGLVAAREGLVPGGTR